MRRCYSVSRPEALPGRSETWASRTAKAVRERTGSTAAEASRSVGTLFAEPKPSVCSLSMPGTRTAGALDERMQLQDGRIVPWWVYETVYCNQRHQERRLGAVNRAVTEKW